MPIFDYKCGQCEGVTEMLVRDAVAAPACPFCGSEMVKMVGLPAFVYESRYPTDKETERKLEWPKKSGR